MDNERLVSIVQKEFRDATGEVGQEISRERKRAWDRLMRRPMGNEVENESQVVTSDVMDVLFTLLPQFLRLFSTADNLASFNAVGEEDRAQAQQESDYVNYTLWVENEDFFLTVYTWLFDTLIAKNGIVQCQWEKTEKVSEFKVTGVSGPELEIYENDPDVEIVEQEEGDPLSIEDPMTGTFVEQPTYNAKLRRIKKDGKVKVEPVPPDEFRISGARSLHMGTARMVGRQRGIRRSELIEMGFDPKQVSELSKIEVPNEEAQNRNLKSDEINQRLNKTDESQEEVEVCEAYILVDFDEDGRSELRQVFVSGNELLRWENGEDANEVVDRHPFHALCAYPLPHKFMGLGVDDLVGDIQDVASTLLRQVLNNLYRTNNPGSWLDDEAVTADTMDDLLTTSIGQITRIKGNPREAVADKVVPFTAAASFPMLDWTDKVKRDRTGVSADSEGLSIDSLKNIQQSVLAQAVDQSQDKILSVARIFAETGFKSLIWHVRELLIKHQDVEKMVELRNKFVRVDPSKWQERYNVTVQIGIGRGNRERRLLHLESIWQKQVAIWQGGGQNLVVKPRHLYNTVAEMVRNGDLNNPDLFFQDPGEALAPPQQDEQAELQRQAQEIEARKQQLDAERQQIAMAKLELQAQRQQMEHERRIAELQMKAQEAQDRLQIENERLSNQVTDMMLKQSKDERELQLKAADTAANVRLKDAQTKETLSRAEAQELETDAVESGLMEMLESGQAEQPAESD